MPIRLRPFIGPNTKITIFWDINEGVGSFKHENQKSETRKSNLVLSLLWFPTKTTRNDNLNLSLFGKTIYF